jgi:hypothetical protein
LLAASGELVVIARRTGASNTDAIGAPIGPLGIAATE